MFVSSNKYGSNLSFLNIQILFCSLILLFILLSSIGVISDFSSCDFSTCITPFPFSLKIKSSKVLDFDVSSGITKNSILLEK